MILNCNSLSSYPEIFFLKSYNHKNYLDGVFICIYLWDINCKLIGIEKNINNHFKTS